VGAGWGHPGPVGTDGSVGLSRYRDRSERIWPQSHCHTSQHIAVSEGLSENRIRQIIDEEADSTIPRPVTTNRNDATPAMCLTTESGQ
jgi:hypothetical protein